MIVDFRTSRPWPPATHPGLLVFGLVIIAVVAVAGCSVRADGGRTTTHRRCDAGDAGDAPLVSGHHSHHGDGGGGGGGD